ncbi:MAG: hypothetical protein M3256_25300, partial [Actinomycetota bacterium]|nr:hypothetical protein [Actinomycetota bacterium]
MKGHRGHRQPRFDAARARPEEGGPRCGFLQFCQARHLLVALTNEELQWALDSVVDQESLDRVFSMLRLQASARKNPRLVRVGLVKLVKIVSPVPLHQLSWTLSSGAIDLLVDLLGVGIADDEPELERDELALPRRLREDGGLAGWSRNVPVGVIRLSLESLWDDERLTLEERDEFLALLDDPERLAATAVAEHSSEVNPVLIAGPVDAGAPREGHGRTSLAKGSSGRDVAGLVGHAVDVALASRTWESDVARHLAGLEWLIDLDPGDSGVWFQYGRLLASSPPGRNPKGYRPCVQFLTGQLQGLVEAGDEEAVISFGAEHPGVVEAAVGQGTITDLPVLFHAFLRSPREAARLLALVREPFEGWRPYFGRIRADATAVLGIGRGDDVEILLAAVEDRLFRWAARRRDDDDPEELTAEAGATMVLRAKARRRRKDFMGALRLLADVDMAALDFNGRLSAEVEWAMATAEISAIEELGFPADPERSHLLARLERARPHLERALERDPAHLEASLLLGMQAYFVGEDDRAARHLAVAGDRLSETSKSQDLTRSVEFHRALARLRQLDAGTDEGSYHEMVSAIDEGYAPTDADLVSATVALQAHGSPRAGDFLAQAVALQPRSTTVVSLLLQQARIGNSTAASIAEAMASDSGRRLVDRFELLDAALMGAEARADQAATTRLIGRIEDVVARVSSRALDERWAEALATGETLRT